MANVAKSEINQQNCIHTWQRRLGHRDPNAVKRIDKEGLATGIHIDECSVTFDEKDSNAGKKAIDCKWVFKLKQNADGNVYRHKARRRKFAPLK